VRENRRGGVGDRKKTKGRKKNVAYIYISILEILHSFFFPNMPSQENARIVSRHLIIGYLFTLYFLSPFHLTL
jgi:hypothetical protein